MIHKISLAHVDGHLKQEESVHRRSVGLLGGTSVVVKDVTDPLTVPAELTDLSLETFLKTTCFGLMVMTDVTTCKTEKYLLSSSSNY